MGMAQSITCVSIAVWLLDDFLSHSINICLSSVGILQLTQLRSRCYSVGPPSVPHSLHLHCLLYSWVLSSQLLFISSFCVSFACCFCHPPPPPEWSFSTSHVKMTKLDYICVNVCRESMFMCVCEREWGEGSARILMAFLTFPVCGTLPHLRTACMCVWERFGA